MSVGLPVKEVAKILGTSDRTVRRYLAEGKLTGHRIVREHLKPLWRVDADSVQQLLETRPVVHKDTGDSLAINEGQGLREELQLLRQENAELKASIDRLAVAIEEFKQGFLPATTEEPDPEVKLTWWRRLFQSNKE